MISLEPLVFEMEGLTPGVLRSFATDRTETGRHLQDSVLSTDFIFPSFSSQLQSRVHPCIFTPWCTIEKFVLRRWRPSLLRGSKLALITREESPVPCYQQSWSCPLWFQSSPETREENETEVTRAPGVVAGTPRWDRKSLTPHLTEWDASGCHWGQQSREGQSKPTGGESHHKKRPQRSCTLLLPSVRFLWKKQRGIHVWSSMWPSLHGFSSQVGWSRDSVQCPPIPRDLRILTSFYFNMAHS